MRWEVNTAHSLLAYLPVILLKTGYCHHFQDIVKSLKIHQREFWLVWKSLLWMHSCMLETGREGCLQLNLPLESWTKGSQIEITTLISLCSLRNRCHFKSLVDRTWQVLVLVFWQWSLAQSSQPSKRVNLFSPMFLCGKQRKNICFLSCCFLYHSC